MNWLDQVPDLLPSPDAIFFWGFITLSGLVVAQVSNKLVERFLPDQDEDDLDDLDEDEPDQQGPTSS